MGSFSIWHWIIVLLIILLLFGAGKLPSVMGDIAKGVKAFKAGLKEGEDETPATPPVSTNTAQPVPPPAAAQAAPHQATAAPQANDPAKPHQG